MVLYLLSFFVKGPPLAGCSLDCGVRCVVFTVTRHLCPFQLEDLTSYFSYRTARDIINSISDSALCLKFSYILYCTGDINWLECNTRVVPIDRYSTLHNDCIIPQMFFKKDVENNVDGEENSMGGIDESALNIYLLLLSLIIVNIYLLCQWSWLFGVIGQRTLVNSLDI